MSSQFLFHTPVPRTIITLLALLFLLPCAFAATFVVNDLGDASDAHLGDGIAATSGGVTTLRAAIEEASYAADADEITFDPAIFSSEQTINLGSQIRPNYTITITGPGADLLTISGQDTCQIFKVYGGAEFTMNGITLAHGYSPVSGAYSGGALASEVNSSLHISNCVFQSNYAEYGGGACYILGDSEIYRCKFLDNWSIGRGGAILYEDIPNASISDCTFSGNSSQNSIGGAVQANNFTVMNILGSTFVNNSAFYYGGAVDCLGDGDLFMVNSTFFSNHANQEAGGIALGVEGTSLVYNCTVTCNEADFDQDQYGTGGGVGVYSSSAPQIGNTIVANNIDHAETSQDVLGSFESLGGNLIGIGDGSTGFTGTNDQVGTTASPIDAKLGPLQDNGGPTLTCMPQADSPAINAGLNALITNPPFDGPPFYDQRGPDFVRIYDDIVDIGAVERQLPPDTTPPTLTLLGDPLVSHECGAPFTDPGATAEDNIDGDISADIQVTGSVDSASPGEYTLTYNVSDSSGNPATPVSRTVTIEDTTPPQITLLGDPLVSHECHTPYTDAGATASDTCDQALPAVNIDTSAVNTDVPGTYIVNFSIADAAGNSAPLVSRTVNVIDTLPPAITLIGDNPLTIQCLSTYTDPGATASDACDTALPAVTIDTSTLDTNATGTYTVTYSVTDASGNPAPLVSRTVIVEGTCIPPNHTADQNADYLISLSELLRVIQFFNSGGFHCQSGTEDGYAPGSGGDQTCAPHASDYNTHDWTIGLSELLRLIQFFNSAGYHPCPGSEDGFCPGVGAE